MAVFTLFAVPGLLEVSVMMVGALKGIPPRKPRFFDAIIIIDNIKIKHQLYVVTLFPHHLLNVLSI